jgi:hypothetical protein
MQWPEGIKPRDEQEVRHDEERRASCTARGEVRTLEEVRRELGL